LEPAINVPSSIWGNTGYVRWLEVSIKKLQTKKFSIEK